MHPEEKKQVVEDLNKELSDFEESAEHDAVYSFKRPPRSHSERLAVLSEADRRYEVHREYLEGTVAPQMRPLTGRLNSLDSGKKEPNYPPNVNMTRLLLPRSSEQAQQSEVIIAGLQRRAYTHSTFVGDLISDTNPDTVVVDLPPDEPYFVRGTPSS